SPPVTTLLPYTTLFRSPSRLETGAGQRSASLGSPDRVKPSFGATAASRARSPRRFWYRGFPTTPTFMGRPGSPRQRQPAPARRRSEEHTSELQSRENLV